MLFCFVFYYFFQRHHNKCPNVQNVSFVYSWHISAIYNDETAVNNRIYDGVEAETRKSQASFQII